MKQKLIYVLMAFLFVTSCSVDRMQNPVVITGADGSTTLVLVSEEPEGDNCPAGGTRLDFGVDTNDDGELSEDEITSTAFVCNGIDGQDGADGADGTSALVEVTGIDAGDECTNGGVLVTNGYDLNGNGELEENEIAGSTVVCNGENGTDGQDGFNTLVRTNRISSEEGFCEEGGFVIEIGLDTNRNGVLDDSEVLEQSTTYVCDGEDGKSLVARVEELDEENQFCSNGGFLVTIGLDQNGNGELDVEEEGVPFPICNGEDGQDGEDGFNSLTFIEEITNDSNEVIGYTIYVGLDVNRNGELDEVERTSSFTLFNGEDGQDGTDGTDGVDGFSSLISTEQGFDEELQRSYTEFKTGLDLNRNGVLEESEVTLTTRIYDGVQGVQGEPGQDGVDGEDGIDGNSVIVKTEVTETGTIVIFGYLIDEQFVEINRIFVENGTDGQDGTDGVDGQDGSNIVVYVREITEEDGSSCTNGGVIVFTGSDTNGNEELDESEVLGSFEICNGSDGEDGQDGEDGVDGQDGSDGAGSYVTICHRVTHNNNIPQEWVDKDYVTLTLTLSEYVKHVYEYHNGNSTQNDAWGSCDDYEFEPQYICIYNRTTVYVTNQQQFDYYMGYSQQRYPYWHLSYLGRCY